jgi:hypothetical protein
MNEPSKKELQALIRVAESNRVMISAFVSMTEACIVLMKRYETNYPDESSKKSKLKLVK